MRRNSKRLLSLILSAAMVFTMNTAVFAEPVSGVADGEQVVAQTEASAQNDSQVHTGG